VFLTLPRRNLLQSAAAWAALWPLRCLAASLLLSICVLVSMENRFWFCDRFRRFRRGDEGVPYACESYARPSGDVSHGFLREVERRRRGNTPFTQLSQQSFCELGMKGCKRIQKNCATRPLHAPPSMKSRLPPMAAN